MDQSYILYMNSFHYKDMTVVDQSYILYLNSYICKTISLYRDGPMISESSMDYSSCLSLDKNIKFQI